MGAVGVEVDRAAILEEAAAIAASSSDVDAGAPPALEPAPVDVGADAQLKAADVAPAVRLLVEQCCAAFAPAWQVSKEESNGVADAAALVMAHWMPDGVLEPKYLAIVTLATSLYGVAAKRRLADGSWAPLHAPKQTPPANTPAPGGGSLRIV